jgi:hypothetical protein
VQPEAVPMQEEFRCKSSDAKEAVPMQKEEDESSKDKTNVVQLHKRVAELEVCESVDIVYMHARTYIHSYMLAKPRYIHICIRT